MPNIKSAKKRVTVIARRKEENRYVKSTLATMVKKFRSTVLAGEYETADKMLPEVTAYIYSAQTKGVIHKNAAARKVGRLSAMLYKARTATTTKVEEVAAPAKEVKVEEVKVEEKPAKKTATKTAAAKTTKTAEKAEKTTTSKTTKAAATKTTKTTATKTTKKAKAE